MKDKLRAQLIHACGVEPGPLAMLARWSKARQAFPGDDPIQRLRRILAELSTDTKEPPALKGVRLVTLLDDAYPEPLRHLEDPPLLLHLCGDSALLSRQGLGIVGARACTTYGRQVAGWIAATFARLGTCIVSGLALGIDACAHQAALQADGPTVGVLGGGLDRIYPKAHTALARDIVHKGGLLVSEFPAGTPPRPQNFPVRNRIIAGLCRAIVVVEARERSGSLVTARHAVDQGKNVFAVPGPIHCPSSRGTHELIHRGEAQILVGLEDLARELAPQLVRELAERKTVEKRCSHPVDRAVYARLDPFEATPLDCLVAGLRIGTGETLAALVRLEAMGLVQSLAGAAYVRHPLSFS
jgi:DNA processing protein